jgi:hypothetical protein
VKILLPIFVILVLAVPVLAVGIGFEKAWADAPPGWYLKVNYTQTYFDARHPSSIDWWWPDDWLRPWVVAKSSEEVLVVISSDIDVRNKPQFIKKNTVPSGNRLTPGCFDDELIFRVDGQEVKVQPPFGASFESSVDVNSIEYYLIACRRIVKWELLRKSCGD